MDNNKAKEELYKKLIDMLPIKRKDNSDFRVVLENALENYVNLIKDAGVIELTQENMNDIEKSCDAINEIVTLQYQGKHSEAYGRLGEIVKAKMNVLIEGANLSLYRMRKFEGEKRFTYIDMFHIPFEKRGKVKTQRYSIPGYPCLYVGESIYACWEEMDRPLSWMVSKIVCKKMPLLLDLRVPNEKEFNVFDLLRFPLIIACMIPVLNNKDDYKPEYIIPQLLTEYIITNYHRKYDYKDVFKTINGIRYTSVHKNTDFDFPNEKFNNIVFPVVESINDTGYCPVLCEQFLVTEPTCDEYERIRGDYSVDLGKAGYNSEEQLKRNYEVSIFGKIEERLKYRESYKIINRV